jgi:hypothetical protein
MEKRFAQTTLGWVRLFALVAISTALAIHGIGTARAGRYLYAANGNQDGNAFPIVGNTPEFISRATNLGAVDPNSVITVTVWLKLHNERYAG